MNEVEAMLCSALIGLDAPLELARLIKMCLNETGSDVR
jgi:hypothetical protein